MRFRRRRTVLILALAAAAGAAIAVWALAEHDESRRHFHVVTRGLLYRSRQPLPEELAGLKRRDIRMIVNLRHRSEDPQAFDRERQAGAALGVEMINIPSSALPTDDQIAQFLKIVRAQRGAVLVHCELGRSRTGIMVAAYRVVVDGRSPQEALDEMNALGGKLKDDEQSAILALLERMGRDRKDWLDRTRGAEAPGAARNSIRGLGD